MGNPYGNDQHYPGMGGSPYGNDGRYPGAPSTPGWGGNPYVPTMGTNPYATSTPTATGVNVQTGGGPGYPVGGGPGGMDFNQLFQMMARRRQAETDHQHMIELDAKHRQQKLDREHEEDRNAAKAAAAHQQAPKETGGPWDPNDPNYIGMKEPVGLGPGMIPGMGINPNNVPYRYRAGGSNFGASDPNRASLTPGGSEPSGASSSGGMSNSDYMNALRAHMPLTFLDRIR